MPYQEDLRNGRGDLAKEQIEGKREEVKERK